MMTTSQVMNSVNTGRLMLSLWKWIDHYSLPTLFFTGMISVIYFMFRKIWGLSAGSVEMSWAMLWTGLITMTILTAAFGILQYRRLRLEFIETERSNTEIFALLYEMCKQKEWMLVDQGKEHLVINTPANLISWGEQIVIFYAEKGILVNCIASAGGRSTMFTFGIRKTNIRLIREWLTRKKDS